MLSTVLYHCRIVWCSKIFLRAENNPVMLKNSTEHAQSLFTALTVLKFDMLQ